MNHPDLAKDLTGVCGLNVITVYCCRSYVTHILLCVTSSDFLKVRSHDPEEAIRHDVIVTIINAGKRDLNLVNDQLLGFVRERMLDKRVRQIKNYMNVEFE